MDTKGERIESILKGLNISNDRYIFIYSYIQRMLKDYKGQPIDIIKEIPLNLKGNEKYFAMFYTGVSFTSVFTNMNNEMKTAFIVNITKFLKFSDERVLLITNYISDKIRKEIRENTPVVDIVKGIISSNEFIDIEKDYIMFIFGVAFT